MRFHTQVLYPAQIPWEPQFLWDKREHKRSPGLHVSTVYNTLCAEQGLMKTWADQDDPWDTAPSLLHLGFAWEEYILSRSNLALEPGYQTVWRPGELEMTLSNGQPAFMTPDALTANVTWKEEGPELGSTWKHQLATDLHGKRVVCVDDAKYTLKKPFETIPVHWVFQACGYLHGYRVLFEMDVVCFRFFVVHSAGNYLARKKDPQQRKGATNLPIFHVYWLTFEPKEIEDYWKILDTFAVANYDRLLKIQEDSKDAGWRSVPGLGMNTAADIAANMMTDCPIREDLVLPDPFARFE